MKNEKYIDIEGIRTRYFEAGSGPHLVLFHGGHFGSHDAADCAEDWSLNFDGLAQWFHVAARSTPDARMYIYNRAGHFSRASGGVQRNAAQLHRPHDLVATHGCRFSRSHF